jgi:hypothetical protein
VARERYDNGVRRIPEPELQSVQRILHVPEYARPKSDGLENLTNRGRAPHDLRKRCGVEIGAALDQIRAAGKVRCGGNARARGRGSRCREKVLAIHRFISPSTLFVSLQFEERTVRMAKSKSGW